VSAAAPWSCRMALPHGACSPRPGAPRNIHRSDSSILYLASASRPSLPPFTPQLRGAAGRAGPWRSSRGIAPSARTGTARRTCRRRHACPVIADLGGNVRSERGEWAVSVSTRPTDTSHWCPARPGVDMWLPPREAAACSGHRAVWKGSRCHAREVPGNSPHASAIEGGIGGKACNPPSIDSGLR
jgi:hypothetical protein